MGKEKGRCPVRGHRPEGEATHCKVIVTEMRKIIEAPTEWGTLRHDRERVVAADWYQLGWQACLKFVAQRIRDIENSDPGELELCRELGGWCP